MFILKNVTAVQLEPTLVLEGVDIAIEGSLIKAVGPICGPSTRRPTIGRWAASW